MEATNSFDRARRALESSGKFYDVSVEQHGVDDGEPLHEIRGHIARRSNHITTEEISELESQIAPYGFEWYGIYQTQKGGTALAFRKE